MALVFVLSRAYAHASGLRFDAHTWQTFWHFVDPALLASSLSQSLWHLHAQPPLFNAWLGAYQRLFGSHMGDAFALTYVVLGICMMREVYLLAHRAGLSRWAASALASVIAASPATLLFESFLFYTYPEALLLLICANSAISAVERPSLARFAGLACASCALTLLRSLFHPIWLFMSLGWVLILVGRPHARTFALAAAIPVTILLLLSAKSLALYGTTSMSTWRGMNLARVVVDRMPAEHREAWVQEGILSPVARIGGFKPLEAYREVIQIPAATGIELLDRPQKSNGAINLHHLAYIELSETLERDALTVIWRRPGWYVASVWRNLRATFEPAWHYRAITPAAGTIAGYANRWHMIAGGGWAGKSGPAVLRLSVLLALGAGAVWCFRRRGTRDTTFIAMTLSLFHTTYVIGVGALLERYENQRFRFDVDPMIAIVVLVLAQQMWRRVAERRSASSRSSVGYGTRPQ